MANPKQFLISPALPLKFIPILPINPEYNSVPLEFRPGKCYKQKFQTNGSTYIQFLSDWVPTVTLYNLNGTIAGNLIPVVVNTQIRAYTFLVYEVFIDFSNYQPGDYYVQITYVDAAAVLQTWQCHPFSLAVLWPYTQLWQYKNDENTDNIIFRTGIEFNIRVESSAIFVPAFEGNTYTDQQLNATKLPSVAYQTFKLYLGNSPGIPDWLIDTFNYIICYDSIKIDGTYYQNQQGSKWDINRAVPETQGAETLAGYAIDVMKVDNSLVQRLINGNITLNGYTPFTKVIKLTNIAVDQVINVITKYDLLEKIIVENIGGIPFTLKVGRTLNGGEIGSKAINNTAGIFGVKELYFVGPYDLYLDGITAVGMDLNIFIHITSLAAIPVSGPGSSPVSTQYKKNTALMYIEAIPGEFANDFDISTGLGKPAGNYPNFAICDGRNGTEDLQDYLPRGWTVDGSKGNFGDIVGTDVINITNVNQLPEIAAQVQLSENGTGDGSGGRAARSDNEAVDQTTILAYANGPNHTPTTLLSQDIDNNPKAKLVCFIQAIS